MTGHLAAVLAVQIAAADEIARPDLWEARRPGDRRDERRDRRTAALIIGAIILMDDGTRCRIAWIDAEGVPWCTPLPPNQARE